MMVLHFTSDKVNRTYTAPNCTMLLGCIRHRRLAWGLTPGRPITDEFDVMWNDLNAQAGPQFYVQPWQNLLFASFFQHYSLSQYTHCHRHLYSNCYQSSSACSCWFSLLRSSACRSRINTRLSKSTPDAGLLLLGSPRAHNGSAETCRNITKACISLADSTPALIDWHSVQVKVTSACCRNLQDVLRLYGCWRFTF